MKPKPKWTGAPATGVKRRKLYYKAFGVQDGVQVFNLKHTGTIFGTASDLRVEEYDAATMPCLEYARSISVASWTIGAVCDTSSLAQALRDTGFEVVVLTFTNEVLDNAAFNET